MRESIGASFVLYAIVIFVSIFCLFFISGLSYTKAFKIKNRIVDIIEENGGYNKKAQDQISSALKSAGYRVKKGNPECNKISKINKSKFEILTNEPNNYRYCVYKVKTNKGDYYGAVAFMYFEIPVIHAHLEFPVYGETKVMGEY